MSIEPFIGMVKWVAFAQPPRGWARCDGQLLPISTNQALFSLLGTRFGGDGWTNFALPDLRGCTPLGAGGASTMGERFGKETHTLAAAEMPQHTHALPASANRATSEVPSAAAPMLGGGQRAYVDRGLAQGTMSPAAVSALGQGAAHENMQPFLTLTAIIALQGIYPSRD
ncbi:phage tail protein [Nocardioides sp. Y6]|uniref:Phage tail protein n=1 Tax=Nocardioides malaquae TaxID=2773426 RepID=A0ABR9RW81_9ACTN|nr:tail fiber protein [Nocardioides malaquae]MBE7325814.1 phage tail protein [Nocardioides malaquae]